MPTSARLMYASEFDRSGYASAAKRYIRALQAVGREVAWRPLVNSNSGRIPSGSSDGAPAWMQELPVAAAPDSPTIWHCMPISWADMRAAHPRGRFIGQTVWEADPIPRRWHAELAPADEIWVPTEWNAGVLRRSGITCPVHVVPHPIDFAEACDPPYAPPSGRKLFLTVSAWEWRKRPDLTIHAYLRAFTADDPVTLVVKTGPRTVSWYTRTPIETHTWWQVMSIVKQYQNAADVVLVTDDWTDEQVAGLVRAADCYVSLTAVEGWGLGAFDAAVAGVPVVITGHGGQLAWTGADHPGLVPYRMVPADHPDRTMFEPGMMWALADVEAAAEMLRAVFEGRSATIPWAAKHAAQLRDRYSLTRIGALMTGLTG